ncbi:MAG: hypothetical protein ACREP2_02505 [Rhodanobacteraceae bacterium]
MATETSHVISTTQLARNLSAAIDRVRVQRRPLAIVKGKRIIAQLVPPPQEGYPIAGLATMLADLHQLGKDAAPSQSQPR